MKLHNISFDIVNKPPLDPSYIPIAAYNRAYELSAAEGVPLKVAVLRENGQCAVREGRIHGSEAFTEADMLYLERMLKTMLWSYGGHTALICGLEEMARRLAGVYAPGGARAFDAEFMSRIYEREFTVQSLRYDDAPERAATPVPCGGNTRGCRIGFDAGGSDIKVSAVREGEVIFSEEIVWHPKTQSDPSYHFDYILSALVRAADYLPHVDSVGVSSAGVYVGNRCMAASLFVKVEREVFDAHVKDIYKNAVAELGRRLGQGEIPLTVCNDGDVTALAGAMELGRGGILGIAMGTSEAGGFVDREGHINGQLNELAFTPVDLSPEGAVDEWSGDRGTGAGYFSQDAVIRLAHSAGITLDREMTPAEKLAAVQQAFVEGHPGTSKIYRSIGSYLGHQLPVYHDYYGMDDVLLMGRVLSGGGHLIVEEARRVLSEEYPEAAEKLTLHLPDEKNRRVGQSVAAASL